MPISTPRRRPAVALALTAVLFVGLAAPAAASPWTDAWERLAGWFAGTPLGALWARDARETTALGGEHSAGIDPNGQPRQVIGNEGGMIDPNGRPIPQQNGTGVPTEVHGAPGV